MSPPRLVALALTLALAGCSLVGGLGRGEGAVDGGDLEATSLLGEPLYRPQLDHEFRHRQQELLDEARAELTRAPGDVDSLIWVGRRTAYLGRYREAVEVYADGIQAHPREARLYRHRGHRYLTLRRLEAAEADLEHAAELIAGRPDEVEPDGLPNAAGIPTSTLATNVWYHLGLARYLRGDWDGAAAAWGSCLEASTREDMYVAGAYWSYLALRRAAERLEEEAEGHRPGSEERAKLLARAAGRVAEAAGVLEPIRPEMKLLENHSYHRLLLMFAERLQPEDLLERARGAGGLELATTGYGVAAWWRLTGEAERADELLEEILRGGEWPAFGYLAAEADLARAANG